jgi:low density lipoprotein-related protein 2
MSIPFAGGNKTAVLTSGVVGAPHSIAFDWIGRNMYIGNRKASTIEIIKVDGDPHFHRVLLSNNGNITGVAYPKAVEVDPYAG